MNHLKLYESFSNYSTLEIPEGVYDGVMKGWQVYSDAIDSGFKTKDKGIKGTSRCKIFSKEGKVWVELPDGNKFYPEV
jgi:hypothetical protein